MIETKDGARLLVCSCGQAVAMVKVMEGAEASLTCTVVCKCKKQAEVRWVQTPRDYTVNVTTFRDEPKK